MRMGAFYGISTYLYFLLYLMGFTKFDYSFVYLNLFFLSIFGLYNAIFYYLSVFNAWANNLTKENNSPKNSTTNETTSSHSIQPSQQIQQTNQCTQKEFTPVAVVSGITLSNYMNTIDMPTDEKSMNDTNIDENNEYTEDGVPIDLHRLMTK